MLNDMVVLQAFSGNKWMAAEDAGAALLRGGHMGGLMGLGQLFNLISRLRSAGDLKWRHHEVGGGKIALQYILTSNGVIRLRKLEEAERECNPALRWRLKPPPLVMPDQQTEEEEWGEVSFLPTGVHPVLPFNLAFT